jgi:peroxiredoxin
MKTMDETGPGRPGVGESAPDFNLRRTFEESVHLGTLLGHGPVVLAFYVFDFGHV